MSRINPRMRLEKVATPIKPAALTTDESRPAHSLELGSLP